MVMIGEGGTVAPAFLPNFVDVVGKAAPKNVFQRLQGSRLQYDGLSQVVPKILKAIVDPKPRIKFEGPIYQISGPKVEMKLGCFTDGLAIFHLDRAMSEADVVVVKSYVDLEDPTSRFHGVRISPQVELMEHNLSRGSAFIVWNVRHAARPSFKENFNRLVQLHNPVAILLTAVRMYKPSFIRLDDTMETTMDWGLDEGIGLMGGVALLRDKSRVRGKTMVSGIDEHEIRMVASIKAAKTNGAANGSEAGELQLCGSPEI